jgi:hypothetical protein
MFRTTKEIVIPAGTLLTKACNEHGGKGYVETPVAIGKDFTAWLVMQNHADLIASGYVGESDDIKNNHASMAKGGSIDGIAMRGKTRCSGAK